MPYPAHYITGISNHSDYCVLVPISAIDSGRVGRHCVVRAALRRRNDVNEGVGDHLYFATEDSRRHFHGLDVCGVDAFTDALRREKKK